MIIKIGKAAKILGVTVETMRKWERKGEVVPLRKSKSGTRYYDSDTIHAIADGSACVQVGDSCAAQGGPTEAERILDSI